METPLKTAELERMFRFEREHWWYRSLHRFIKKRVRLNPASKVLDLGAGSGFFSSQLAKEFGCQVKAVDRSPACTASARAMGLNATTETIEKFLAETPSETFDLIILLDSFYFLSEQSQPLALAQAFSALKPRGKILLHLPAGQLFKREHDQTVGIRKRFSRTNINQLIERAGLSKKSKIWIRYRVCALSMGIGARKLFQKFFPTREPRSDLFPLPEWAQSALAAFQSAEDFFPFPMPWGSSLYVELSKIAEPPLENPLNAVL